MKKNIVIILLSICVVGLGGYLYYDKVINSSKQNLEEINNNVENLNNKDDLNSYELYLKNLQKDISPKEASFTIYSNSGNFKRSIYLETDGSLYLKYENSMNGIDKNKIVNIPSMSLEEYDLTVQGIKLNISNVVDIFFTDGLGQSAIQTLYALSSSGDIYFIASSFDWSDDKISSSNFSPIKIEELHDIINITSSGYSNAISGGVKIYTTDIYGNHYDLEKITSKYNIYN